MRGTRGDGTAVLVEDGIIPAYAGNTSQGLPMDCSTRDHPRVCGEHLPLHFNHLLFWGSSPRMRGTQTDRLEGCRILGIIPAYAGNTYCLRLDGV